MDLKAIIDQIPDYDVFLTVDEMNDSTNKLVRDYPGLVQVRNVGETNMGNPIDLITIGNGDQQALLIGAPHPNEPVGCLVIEFLTDFFCRNPEFLQSLGYTWHFIKAIDAEGVRLNEGWFKGPFTVSSYLRGFYRPPMDEQAEWAFPIDYKGLRFDRPTPESRTLMKVIDKIKPDFMYSLHNQVFGGVFYYLTNADKSLCESLTKIPEWLNIPLHLGEPELPECSIEFAPAIYKSFMATDIVDWLEASGITDPAKFLEGGATSADYAAKDGNGPFDLVTETPYWSHIEASDRTPTQTSKAEAIRRKVAKGLSFVSFMEQHWKAIESDLQIQSPFHSAVFAVLKQSRANMEAEQSRLDSNKDMNVPATRAELFCDGPQFEIFLYGGLSMFVRMLDAEIEAGNDSGRIVAARAVANDELSDVLRRFERDNEYGILPIRNMVGVQAAAGLATAAYARKSRVLSNKVAVTPPTGRFL